MRLRLSLILAIITLLAAPVWADQKPGKHASIKGMPVKIIRPDIRRDNVNRDQPFTIKHSNRAHPDSLAGPEEIEKDTTIELSKDKTLIYLDRSDLIRFNDELMPGIQVLIGSVLLRHDNALLYCDSAYLDQATNSFEAFGRVRMVQADTITITSRHLIYDGNTEVAYLHDDVKMRNRRVTLTTDTLTYERLSNLGYYKCGGTLRDEKNVLVSRHGYYHSDTKQAEFKYDVVGTNPDSRIESDTLTYNTETKVAGIVGPTVIYNQDHTDPDSVLTVIHSDLGWYDTAADQAELLDHSHIIHDKHNFIEGDTIFYDNREGYGKIFHNILMNDTANKMILTGHYGYYQEQDEIMLATDSARFIDYSRPDSLFAHADTLYSFAVDTNKVAIAYHNGRLFSREYQAISDSIIFNTLDSITHLMQLPILWNDSMQVTGDTIRVFPKGDRLDHAQVIGNAMIIQQEDTAHYDQISGKEIIGYFLDQKLEHMEVLGNAESIFFPKDDGRMIGLNRMQSSYMNVYFRNGEIFKLSVFPQPKATMHPMEQVRKDMLKLANFTWQIEARPKDKDDIFTRPKRATKSELEAMQKELREKEKAERRRRRREEQEKQTENETDNDNKQAE